MKTRIVRYWHKGNEHFKVEKWIVPACDYPPIGSTTVSFNADEQEAKGNPYFYVQSKDTPCWTWVAAPLGLPAAEKLAKSIASGEGHHDYVDVVAEFGE